MALKRKLLTALYGGALILPTACGDASTDGESGDDGWTVGENAQPNGEPNNANANPNGTPNGATNITPNGQPNATPNGEPNGTANVEPNNEPLACGAEDLTELPYPGWEEDYYAGAVPDGVYIVCASADQDGACEQLDLEGARALVQPIFDTGCGVFAFVPDSGEICGPIERDDELCCHAIPLEFGECVVGRPLVIDGEVRTGGLGESAGWRSQLEVDASELGDAARATVAAWWADAGEHEHASIASFSRFLLDLMSFAAPSYMVTATTRAIDDEVRHAADCFAIASAYAGQDLAPGSVDVGHYEPQGLEAALVAAIREGCIGETLAAALAEWQAPRVQSVAIRDALNRIADDEGDHALLAWDFVQWAIREHPELREVAVRAFDDAAVALESPWAIGADATDRMTVMHGALTPGLTDRLRRHAYNEVVVPCVEALFS